MRVSIVAAALCSMHTLASHGAVVQYNNKSAWQAAAGSHSTINFTGYPQATLITNQYSNLGVAFTDGIDLIHLSGSFVNDGAGLNGAIDEIEVTFSQPMSSIAIEFPGFAAIHLYSNRSLIYQSTAFGSTPVGNFGGLISDFSFDRAVIYDPSGDVFIDDLHFGPPIPAPGALAIFGLAGLMCSQKRRRAS
jgi:hypothetical protein